jgi:hypothetical protein
MSEVFWNRGATKKEEGVKFTDFIHIHSLLETNFTEQLTIVLQVKQFAAFYGTRRFINVFTRTYHYHQRHAEPSTDNNLKWPEFLPMNKQGAGL